MRLAAKAGVVGGSIEDASGDAAKPIYDFSLAVERVAAAVEEARAAGCEWLHVDFDDHLRPFYFDACGFMPTNAGLIALQDPE
jgi:hypothetical protein